MALYANRDAEALGELYARHVAAMTAEKLHDKGDIAAELAWRDMEIDRLQNLLDARPAFNGELFDTYKKWSQWVYAGDIAKTILAGDDDGRPKRAGDEP